MGAPAGPCASSLELLEHRFDADRSPARAPRSPTCRCRSTPATPASRSWPPSARATAPRRRSGARASTTPRASGADLLAFTLDKTSGDFSPTTRYRDYAISRDLIHWESQSTTRADSPTGLRYQNHVAMGRSILLFARARADDRAFWFLGPATYVGHDGEKPMAITWELHTPLPGDLFAAFAAAVA